MHFISETAFLLTNYGRMPLGVIIVNIEMFYLKMDSTHFVLRLYGVEHTIKDHRQRERKPSAATTWALSDYKQELFYMHNHRQDSTHHGRIYTSRGALVGKRNSSLGPR